MDSVIQLQHFWYGTLAVADLTVFLGVGGRKPRFIPLSIPETEGIKLLKSKEICRLFRIFRLKYESAHISREGAAWCRAP